MNDNQKTTLFIITFLFIIVFAFGCAGSKKFHRNKEGVLKTETRAEEGIHKPDSP